MPLYKNSKSLIKSKFRPPLLNKTLNCEKSLITSPPVEVTANNAVIPFEEENVLIPQNVSPLAADDSNKVAESPKESASFEIKKAANKEAKQDQRLKENAPKKRNKEKQIQDNGKKKLKTQLQARRNKMLREFEKPIKPAKKNKKEKTSGDSQNSQLSISQQYLLLEKINEPAPPENASQEERLEWLQNERNVGLHVQCDDCDKFRYLADVMDPTDLPEKWYCFMNKDCEHNSCEIPEVKISAREEEDLIFNEYNAGSIVWAKLPPYPWWPAMVDDDPDVEQYYWVKSYSDFPTHYNVTFFDSELVSRSWITPKFLKSFRGNENMFSLKNSGFELQFFERFDVAKRQAIEASSYNVMDRLKKFSFLARWPYKIGSYPDDNEKRQKRYKKRITNNNYKRKTSRIKNKTKTTVETKTDIDDKKTTFCTDEQNETNLINIINEEIDNAITDNAPSVSYSPDISFDTDLF
ncbi:zinc finger CW-type PWWP domain protein 1-like [Agrilus planipennis]|uniref:Zinc finger CW-type PWWP domain protein 1-like n=1 Tax=Agrilus planipennis TaxID=224129 RepID=A0A1W4WWI2_AGRPL|nr:zinc finger CW-type PWWP domain protein 1-like [Agrilus planipennis]